MCDCEFTLTIVSRPYGLATIGRLYSARSQHVPQIYGLHVHVRLLRDARTLGAPALRHSFLIPFPRAGRGKYPDKQASKLFLLRLGVNS